MLRKSKLYSMCVQFEPQELPHDMSLDLTPLPSQPLLRACNKVFCLVQVTSGGEVLKIGSEGFKLITKGVRDVVTSSVAQPASGVYTLTAFCTVDNLQDIKLDPPRGSKSQIRIHRSERYRSRLFGRGAYEHNRRFLDASSTR